MSIVQPLRTVITTIFYIITSKKVGLELYLIKLTTLRGVTTALAASGHSWDSLSI